MARILSYEKKNTWIHELSGVTKLIFFLIWTLISMLTYDTRVLVVMVILSLIIFKMSKTEWRQVGSVFLMVLLFLFLNIVFEILSYIPPSISRFSLTNLTGIMSRIFDPPYKICIEYILNLVNVYSFGFPEKSDV